MKLKCALLVLGFVLLSTGVNAKADDEQKNYIWTLRAFGGMNTKASDFALTKGEATLVENVRFEDSATALKKREPILLDADCGVTEPILGLHRLYLSDGTRVTLCNHGDEIKKKTDGATTYTNILSLSSGDNRWQWLTWRNIAIGTDGFNQPVKYDGTSVSATYLGTALATDAGSGSGPDGTYTYKVTCYTASYEASFNVASNTIIVSDNDINLSMIPICPTTYLGEDVVGRKIYRTLDSGSTYKLLSNGTIANNVDFILTDSDADGALGATLSATHTEKPPLGKHSIIHKNRIWIGNDPTSFPSRLYYSIDGSHEFFNSDDYFNIRQDDGDNITGLFNVLSILTVFKNNTVQKVYTNGDDPDADWAISDPFSFYGNQAPYSGANTSGGVVYLGKNGIYLFNGQSSTLLSDKVTPTIRDISQSNFSNVWGAFYKNAFYMAYTSIQTGSPKNDKILIYDFITDRYSIDTFGVNVLDVFDSGIDIEALYSGSSTDGNVFQHTETLSEIIHNEHDEFTGTFDDTRYISEAGGGDTNDPILEIAWTVTIDSVSTTINNTSGIIDRPDVDGSYISQFLSVNAETFDKIFWNESIPATGGNVEFYIRTADTTPDTVLDAWNGPYTDSGGTDISSVQAFKFMQYRFDMTTDNIVYSPNIIRRDGYNIRITFSSSTTDAETTVPFRFTSGWTDFDNPLIQKELTSLVVYYDWPNNTAGNLNVTVENYRGESDTFNIDLLQYPKWYKEKFTDGRLIGEKFKVTFSESSNNPLSINEASIVYDVAPYQFLPVQ